MDRDDAYYQAMIARDPRFDGKFFVGVKTTGIYCRPICPAKPRRQNVEFFASARLAERKGYRPCLRCRPEAAPDSPAWIGTSALVQRALKALSDPNHALDEGEEAFAARFGVGARHLRRLFNDEIGKSPARIAADSRLDFARKLIVETALPMASIAGSSGFASLRRFNAAVQERFRRAPTELRKRARPRSAGPGVTLSLAFRPPLDWEASLAYYRAHAIAGLENFATGHSGGPGAYERVFRWEGGAPGLARVTLAPEPGRLRLEITGGETATLARTVRRVRQMFDLDADPLQVAHAFGKAPGLERLRRKRPGLRSPRGWDPFEIAVCSVLGQLVSMAQANRLIAQLLRAHGEAIPHPVTGAGLHLFPRPEALAEADMAGVGATGARKAVLRELARRVASGELNLSAAQDPQDFRAALRSIKGIGPWTAEYISLRALADTDAFPGTDLVLQRAVAGDPSLDPEAVRPWRGYAAAHLWRAWTVAREDAGAGAPQGAMEKK